MVGIVWQLDLQLPVQSVPITTNVVSSNLTQAIQHYVIKFVSDRSLDSQGPPVSFTRKSEPHDILLTELLWKVALNTINQTNIKADVQMHYMYLFNNIEYKFKYALKLLTSRK